MAKNVLMRFLADNETQERVWFAIPTGVVRGELQALEGVEPEFVMLKRAVIYVGEKPIEVAEMTVRVADISAWGNHFED